MATTKNLNNFTINTVESKEVWDYMIGHDLVNEDEFYIVHGYTAATIRSTTITVVQNQWQKGEGNIWYQVVPVNTVTPNTKVDLQPTAEQVLAMQEGGITLMTGNNNGVVTLYGVGGVPMDPWTIQVLLTEVAFV